MIGQDSDLQFFCVVLPFEIAGPVARDTSFEAVGTAGQLTVATDFADPTLIAGS